jgi:drug/metabolite transporter (DMT)-like permease
VYNPARIMLGSLRALLAGLVDIFLFRRGPDVLPTSTTLLVFVVALHTALNAYFAAKMSETSPNWPFALALSVVFSLAWYYVALKRANKPERFTQTMTAMFGVNVLIVPIVMPLALSFIGQPKEQQSTSGLLALLLLAVSAWAIATNVFIVRKAFEWPVGGAIALFLGQNFVWFIIAAVLFGGPAPT